MYTGNNIENFKKENANEKNQLNGLLIKISERQENINNLLKNITKKIHPFFSEKINYLMLRHKNYY